MSPTGSGKTLGFLLPVLNSLDKTKKDSSLGDCSIAGLAHSN
ncbi:MAG: hypothetical protein IPP64_05310 [Bacteroidetes bacterium]|nr:hypothetical protein [Bacteroidota bacterium]